MKRERERLKRAPWLRLYDLPAWNTIKWRVHKRDGFRCRYADARGRCSATVETSTIEAHHLIKVRHLYADSKSWNEFVRRALDPANIITLCYQHHVAADRPGQRASVAASARPAARSRTRRRKVR